MDLGLHYWNFSNPSDPADVRRHPPLPRAPARLGRIQSTDIAPQQVLQPCCQSVHSAGPKARRYQLTVLSDQRERRQW